MLGALLGGATLTGTSLQVWDDHALGRRFARWATPSAGEQPAPPVDSPVDLEGPRPGDTGESGTESPR